VNGSGALRRILLVELAYVAVGAVAWWAIDPVRQTFLLPQLFTTVARGALFLGFFVAGLMAWRYPELGDGARDQDPESEPPQ
jgi:hypothetical protein